VKNNYEIKNIAIQAIQEEAKAVAALAQYIDDDFVTIVNRILNLQGRVVVTGIGKSAII